MKKTTYKIIKCFNLDTIKEFKIISESHKNYSIFPKSEILLSNIGTGTSKIIKEEIIFSECNLIINFNKKDVIKKSN